MALMPVARAASWGIRESAESQPALPKIAEATIPLLMLYQLGPFKLSHRVVLAPLTRARSYGNVPQPEQAALYYSQRTTEGGLLISREATVTSETGVGNPNVPGIWTQEQIDAWKLIVQAVHAKGAYQPNGAPPPSSTNQRIKNCGIYLGNASGADVSEPRAIETHEVPLFVEEFPQAARNDMEAGFDGIELHAANGYLIDQFLRDGANDRTDEYGGSIENRCRFLIEVVKAVGNAIGFERVGVRISSFTDILDVTDSNPDALSLRIAEALNLQNILYLHVVEPRLDPHEDDASTEDVMLPIRQAYKGTFVAGGGYTRASGNQAIESGKADLTVYGRLFIANPDLPKRFALNAPLSMIEAPSTLQILFLATQITLFLKML